MAEGDRQKMDPTSYMTDRMVADRCTRMWRNSQWKRLHEFSLKDPRAMTWSTARIAQVHSLARDHALVVDAFERLQEGNNPKARMDTSTGELALDAHGLVVEVMDLADEDVPATPAQPPPMPAPTNPQMPAYKASTAPVAAVGGFDVPPTTSASLASSPPLGEAFVLARDEGDYVRAGEALLAYARALAAGVPPAIMAVEVREVLAELAREGAFRLIADLLAVLPNRLTASAVLDLGEKLRIGALLNESALRFHHAVKGQESKAAVKEAEADLVQNVRRVLAAHGVN